MKRVLAVLLAMMVLVCSGCADTKTATQEAAPQQETVAEPAQEAEAEPAPEAEAEPVQEAEPAQEEAAEQVYPYTFTDHAGREVVVEEQAETLATPYSVAITFAAALGKADSIVGKDVGSSSNELLGIIAPELESIESIGNSKEINFELLASLDPDIFINRARNADTLDAAKEVGVTSIGINPETPEQVLEVYDLFANVFGVHERAEVLKKAYMDVINKAEALSKDIPEEDRVTAIVMGSEVGKVANGEMLQSYILEVAGAKNPATAVVTNELWPTVGVEEIFEWDPEYIFLTSYGKREYAVEDITNDPVWADLQAVKNGNVIVMPCEMESWEIPGPHSCLSALWLINRLYPEVYTDAELEADVTAYFELLYPGKTITREILGY